VILQLKIRLLEVSPMVWRRVLVPDTFTLEELHGIIQVTMGWEGIHLYQFWIRAVHYGSFDLCVSSPRVTLAHFRFRKGAKFTYEYDMTDFWRHEIRVEDRLEPEPGRPYPLCIDGVHACPPEECGGPEGYADRRLDALGFEAMDDLATLARLLEAIVLKEQVGRHCQLAERGMRWGQAGLCSGGLGRAGDLGPGPEGLGASAAVFGS
jgi:hypothetical protein